jgi:hypothetical protein
VAAHPEVKESMMKGGYFKIDNIGGATSKLSVISLNTIYYHRANKLDFATGDEQL